MVSTGISEFTFGFGFLHEQITRLRQHTLGDGTRLTGAPVFPSPQFEAERGYDVFLPTSGGDYYYQFKASDFFSRPNSLWLADGTYDSPYFRIKLHKKDFNKQHRVLRALSGTKEFPYKEHTYYVAPEINSLSRYNNAFLAGNITENTRQIPLMECDDIHNIDKHYITFQSGIVGWEQHSISSHHDYSILGKEIFPEYVKHKSEWKTINDRYASELFTKISDIAKQVETTNEIERIMEKFSVDLEKYDRSISDEKMVLSVKVKTLIATAFILSYVFGATLFFVGSQDNKDDQKQ